MMLCYLYHMNCDKTAITIPYMNNNTNSSDFEQLSLSLSLGNASSPGVPVYHSRSPSYNPVSPPHQPRTPPYQPDHHHIIRILHHINPITIIHSCFSNIST